MKHLFLLLSLFSSVVFATTQKLPIDINYQVDDETVTLNMKFQKDLKDFQVVKVKGVDGLKVSTFAKTDPRNVSKKTSEMHLFEYTKSPGLAHIMVELQAKVDGKFRTQMISIPVGQQAQEDILNAGDKKLHQLEQEGKIQ